MHIQPFLTKRGVMPVGNTPHTTTTTPISLKEKPPPLISFTNFPIQKVGHPSTWHFRLLPISPALIPHMGTIKARVHEFGESL